METLIENVDRSAVVLVFLSNRLKNSAACRTGTTLSFSSCLFILFASFRKLSLPDAASVLVQCENYKNNKHICKAP